MRVFACVPLVMRVSKTRILPAGAALGRMLTKMKRRRILVASISESSIKDFIRFCKPVAPVKVSLRAIFRVGVYPHSTVKSLKKVVLKCFRVLRRFGGGGNWNLLMKSTDEKSNKKSQVLVLDTLNDLFNEAASDDETKRPISIGCVLVYSDGTVTSEVSGSLDRILLTGALTDLVNQIFFECKQREINEMVEKTVTDLHLASLPTDGGRKPN